MNTMSHLRHVGFMGLGKLGLPCALAIKSKGHIIYGYDPDPEVKKILINRVLPYKEVHAQGLLESLNIIAGGEEKDLQLMVQACQTIFVPIQTPHDPKYEGSTRLPEKRVDFDYTYLKSGIKQLADKIKEECEGTDRKINIIIISTVLPGTIDREIKPLFNEYMSLCYNPFFIAMGTTIDDFLNPEFVLLGSDDSNAAKDAEEFYLSLHERPSSPVSFPRALLLG